MSADAINDSNSRDVADDSNDELHDTCCECRRENIGDECACEDCEQERSTDDYPEE